MKMLRKCVNFVLHGCPCNLGYDITLMQTIVTIRRMYVGITNNKVMKNMLLALRPQCMVTKLKKTCNHLMM